MQPVNITTNEAIFYASVVHAVLGFLLGLIPLITGFLKKEKSYGVFGFLGSLVGGAILGLFLSLPVAVIFTWLILRKSKQASAEAGELGENPVAAEVENLENR